MSTAVPTGRAFPSKSVLGALITPAAVGRFTIRGTLGAGAFGREVAVKVPLETAVRTDAERARFLKEAHSAATINHPNVCQVHEVGGPTAGRTS